MYSRRQEHEDEMRRVRAEERTKRAAIDYAEMREHLDEIRKLVSYWENGPMSVAQQVEELEKAIVYWAFRNNVVKLDPKLLLDKLSKE